MEAEKEFWLSGPVEGIPALLQPVAHALLQARREVKDCMQHFSDDLLWQKPDQLASAGFHLQHLRGVLDRLLTYARGEMLTEQQLAELKNEGQPYNGSADTSQLLAAFEVQVEKALTQIRNTDAATLADTRWVGRARIPSTVIGLLVHAAEHTMRHTGQLLVTVRWVKSDIVC